jgi:glycosyltransferase involved in cell wall biosynthesis
VGQLWCRDVPLVKPSHGEPKHVTLIVPYYDNPEFFRFQLDRWDQYVYGEWLSVIVVDDGSPTHPAAEVVSDYAPPPTVNLRVFRIEVDVRWNWLAARNIGAEHAPDGWILLTDMDHVVPSATLDAVIHGEHDPGLIYAFARKEHTGQVIAPHSASFLLTRSLFWRIGGYDEGLSGYYGTDGDFRRRAAKQARFALLPSPLIRHEYQGDSSTRKYLRKQPQDARVRQLIDERERTGRPIKALTFPYHEETAWR